MYKYQNSNNVYSVGANAEQRPQPRQDPRFDEGEQDLLAGSKIGLKRSNEKPARKLAAFP